ncbi:MAG: transglutaminase domain-containing protein [Anaerolineales bacterium]|nr:transglutaminase domain-containing protein [Anaerolineales bacterium]
MEKSSTPAASFSDLLSSMRDTLPKRAWDWQAAALTVALIQIAATRLVISEWVPFLGVVEVTSFLAVVLGLIMGYSSLTRRQIIFMGIEYGLLLIPMQLLTTIEATDSLYMDLRGILIRLFNSFSLFAQNQPVYDTLFFVTLSSLGFWIIGLHAGYQLARFRNFLNIIIPSGLVILIIQTYDSWVPFRVWGLAVYIFIALALLGRLYFLESRIGWKTKHVFLSSDIEWDISRSALTFAAAAVFIAWALPGVLTNVKPVSDAWDDFIDPIVERLSDAVSALDSPYGAVSSGDFYGTDLSLGSNAPISDTAVFFVEVDQIEFKPVRYYWRGRVYDQYVDGQWSNTSVTRQFFDPESDELQLVDPLTRSEASFTVTLNFPQQNLLYSPAEAIWVDHESRLVTSPINDTNREVTAWLADPGLVAGNSYQVRAMIANPSIQELRAAGTEYPQWVTDRYLQIPQELVQPLNQLAERVTRGYTVPFDKAQAITSFLRREIKYTTTLTESPPSYQDPLLWVLFEYKKGFCMYYASAEVLMLRTLGIPARMAVGFAEGEFDAERDRYTVARFNSHAWPEVYFPGVGWVEFEPTGNQDPLDRPQERIDNDSAPTVNNQIPESSIDEGPLNLPGVDPTLLEDENSTTPTPADIAARFLYPTLLIGILAIALFFTQRYSLVDRLPVYLASRYTKSGRQPPNWLSRWSRWAILTPVERSFHTIDIGLHWLHNSQPAHATPFERAQALKKVLPSAQDAITTLSMEHETSLFTSHTGNITRARQAGLKILLETWRARTFNYIETINRRFD